MIEGSLASRDVDALSMWSPEVLRQIPRIWLPFVLIAGLAVGVIHLRDRAQDRRIGTQSRRALIHLQEKILESELFSVRSLLLHLAHDRELALFLNGVGDRTCLEEQYVHLCRVAGTFDQVRVLGSDGHEQLRVNYNAGAPAPIGSEGLQSKSSRYYVTRAMELELGDVYISRFDLNVEHEAVEEPWKPMIRFATPLIDGTGASGILVLNYLGSSLLDRLARATASTQGWTALVNDEGYFLQSPNTAVSWGFMLGLAPTFAPDHPAAWERIRSERSGEFIDAEGLFTFRSIEPLAQDSQGLMESDLRITALSFLPLDILYASSTRLFERIAIAYVLAGLIVLGIAWRLGYAASLRRRHESELVRSEQRLRQLSKRLLDVQEQERRSLSRDLHDEVGQLATVVTLDLKRARSAQEATKRDDFLAAALQHTSELLESMHRLTGRLRSITLDDLGLRASVEACVAELEQRVALRIDLRLEFGESDIPSDVAIHVLRIVQEALTNVVRHSQSQRAFVSISGHEGILEICVEDHGVGFDPRAVPTERLGLLGMQERVELLGGTFLLRSAPGRGTIIQARIPLGPDSKASEGYAVA